MRIISVRPFLIGNRTGVNCDNEARAGIALAIFETISPPVRCLDWCCNLHCGVCGRSRINAGAFSGMTSPPIRYLDWRCNLYYGIFARSRINASAFSGMTSPWGDVTLIDRGYILLRP